MVDMNEHLGLIVAGLDEEQKNIDANISKCRASLFALLGPAFAYKVLMSPKVQVHIWRTCSLPVLLSGLPALPIRPSQAKSLQTFHNKILRVFFFKVEQIVTYSSTSLPSWRDAGGGTTPHPYTLPYA